MKIPNLMSRISEMTSMPFLTGVPCSHCLPGRQMSPHIKDVGIASDVCICIIYIGAGRNGFRGALEAFKLLRWVWYGNQNLPCVIDSPLRL